MQLWDFSSGPKHEFETAMVNDPSVIKPLKFYCILIWAFGICLVLKM